MLNTAQPRLHPSESRKGTREGEQGFLLLGLIVAIFLILLVLGVAAPRAAHELRREREVETARRGNAYVRAIEVYYLKNGNYPTSVEQLEKTNNVRFLRKRYMDPMTGKDDWRVIHLGEAKTTVKGFFGKPLGGIESTSLGGSSAGGAGSTGSAFGSSGSSSGGGLTSSFGSSSGSGSGGLTSSFGSSSSGTGSTGLSSSTSGTSSGSGSNGIGGQSGIGSAATAGPIVGIGLMKDGNSIMTLNEQTTYETWEFLYDPRIEQLKAKVNLFGGGMASTDAANLGSAADSKSSASGDLNFGSGSSSGSQSPSGGLGSGSSGNGGFGSGFGSGTGSSPSPTTNTPQ